jgi:hypothetical protein
MATTIGTTTKTTPEDNRVYHPLDRLRGTIRKYVVIEGILSILIFLIAWFTLALALDYGLFKAFSWDWVQDSAGWLRIVALGVALALLAGILIFRIVRRLTTELSYPGLALVLERRFPKVLGDRLITAVELIDVEQAAKYGYSAAMIRKTIDEAREQVGKVPVNEVFNWRRLRLMTALVIGSIVGLVAIGFGSYAIAARGFDTRTATWKCYHVSTILVERNLLMRDTPWPRRALLELKEMDEKGGLRDMSPSGIRVARDGAPPTVRVRAYRWVIADSSTFDGWRPLKWSDVNESLIGMSVPPLADSMPIDLSDKTADDILENPQFRGTLSTAIGLAKYEELQKVFQRLEEMAADPSNGRKLRKLDRPREVSFKYRGLDSAGDGLLKPEGANDYAGEIGGLREDVLFSVRAEDYRTPQRGITRVPPPALNSLMKIEYQPAYLHYASPLIDDPNNPGQQVVAGWDSLKPYHQMMAEERLTLTGTRTTFAVPVGTELVLTAVTEKPIAKAYARPKVGRIPGAKYKIVDGKEVGLADLVPLPVTNGNTFTYEFRGERDKITAAVEFDFVYENEDGLRSTREMMIQATEDSAPAADVIPETIRKVGKEYWVTPKARIPFNPESNIRDDYGLSKVAYRATFKPADAAFVQAARAAQFGRSLPAAAASGDFRAIARTLIEYVDQVRSDEANAEKSPTYALSKFYLLDGSLKRETLDNIRKNLLGKPMGNDKADFVKRFTLETRIGTRVTYQANGVIDTFAWTIDGDYFDVGKIELAKGKLLEVSPGDIQPRYELQLSIEATETNFDTGPKVGKSDPISILVVSAGDLLVKIGDDEEKMGIKLEDAIKKLAGARGKYEFVRSKADLQNRDELDAVKVRSKDAIQDVAKARELVEEVGRQFRRLEGECVVNVLREDTTALLGQIANRLDRALGKSPSPVSKTEDTQLHTGQSDALPFGVLTPKATFPVSEKRLNDAQTAFEEGRYPEPRSVTEAYLLLTQLEDEIRIIRAIIGEIQSKEKLQRDLQAVLERQQRIGEAIRVAKFADDADKIKTTPKLGDVGQLFLAKGEVKKVKQTIKWRQFPGDGVTVKVVSSDPAAVIVPAELKLDFEKNNIDFEYEIRAGTKEGEFTVTLTPEVGDKVEVKIQVK